jgi:hypothetical protein
MRELAQLGSGHNVECFVLGFVLPICQSPRPDSVRHAWNVPSVKLLIASTLRCVERKASVTSGDPSLIIR